MTLPVIILGGGGHAKVLIETLRRSSTAILGITDPDGSRRNSLFMGVPVLGDDSTLAQYPPGRVLLVNGLGSTNRPRPRALLYERCTRLGYHFASVCHPAAVVAADVLPGAGTQFMAGSVVQPGSTVGCNVIVNTNATVDHDCQLGDHVHLSPGVTLSGGVRVGRATHIGTGATVIQGIAIGENCLIAAGAVVVTDVPDGAVFAGVPAKEVKT